MTVSTEYSIFTKSDGKISVLTKSKMCESAESATEHIVVLQLVIATKLLHLAFQLFVTRLSV